MIDKTTIKNNKHKNYLIKSKYMDYKFIRLQLYNTVGELLSLVSFLGGNSYDNFMKINDFSQINDSDVYLLKTVKNITDNLIKLHEFVDKYTINELKCVDFSCNDLSKQEEEYLCEKKISLNYYSSELDDIRTMFINKYDEIKNKIMSSTYYFDSNYKMSPHEINFSIGLYLPAYLCCEVTEREYFGYIMKLILLPSDYKLFRNMLNIFYDNQIKYPSYIKGKFEFVDTFDEDRYRYKKIIVYDKFYDKNNDSKPIEDFERTDIISKYDLIQEYIRQNNL
jgi:hypothetical protein